MTRKILLVEPNYQNKYPPIGLMKLSTYHKTLGDKVEFFKGDLKQLIVRGLTNSCLRSLQRVDAKNNWKNHRLEIEMFIKRGYSSEVTDLLESRKKKKDRLYKVLKKYSSIYRAKKTENYPKWDRVYVTTLFTFYWNITVETIHLAKTIVRDHSELFIGGVLASLLPTELERETGIKPHTGLLDKPGILDPENNRAKKINIDNLVLDYSILDEIEYKYPTGSAYFTFMTKGCTRKCAFCSVPILEPTYKPKIETKDKFFEVKELYGEQQHLLLMDNNVLASPKFSEIIQEIKDMGFVKGATFIEPNQYEIAITNLRAGINDRAYTRRAVDLINQIAHRVKGKTRVQFSLIVQKHDIGDLKSATKKNLLRSYKAVAPIFEKYRNKLPKPRYVDFNQGTDARYVTDELMKLMSEIPIRPLRIAFDYWGLRDKYENAIRLAAKYGITELSNYILYNFKDAPDELYKRLEINVRLNEELGVDIYSFPMKYIPLFGEEAKDRNYIGTKWNRKYIRAVQTILNATKGIVAPGRSFFNIAFGKTLEEFREILYMPEPYILFRSYFQAIGLTYQWRVLFNSLNEDERVEAFEIIHKNEFGDIGHSISPKIAALLEHYTIKKKNADQKVRSATIQKLKRQFDKLIKEDQFIELTLTYDFEKRQSAKQLAIA